jgi:serine/threonine-protein kinase
MADSEEIKVPGPIPDEVASFPKIPGYRILGKIGSGSVADVYKAVQLNLARVVAVKVLAAELAARPETVKEFVREARAVARLSHENIVAVYDVGVAAGVCYFAMEYVDGLSLEKIIRRGGAMDEKRVTSVAVQVAKALEHAWTFKMVHRDIKPSNILINRRSVVKICDLGLAKGVLEDDSLAARGLTVGTPSYISPEQARGLAGLDIRSDVYSLGATLYHALTGVPPFQGNTPAEVMAKHVTEEPAPVNARVPTLSDGIAYFISRMMEKDLSRRYDPAALVRDIEAFQRGGFQIPAAAFSDSSLALRAQTASAKKESKESAVDLKPLRRSRKASGIRRLRRKR